MSWLRDRIDWERDGPIGPDKHPFPFHGKFSSGNLAKERNEVW